MNKIFYTFVLSALVLLSVQCNPKSQESDEQLENDSIIEYAELLSITCHDDYTDVKISNPWDSARLLHRYILVPKTQKRSIESTARNRRKDSVFQYISLCLGTLQPVGAIRRIIANRRSLRPLLYQNARFALSGGKRETDRCRKFHVARHRTSNVVESGCHLIISFRKRRIRTYRENGNTHYRMRRLFGNFTSGPGRMDKILRSVIR